MKRKSKRNRERELEKIQRKKQKRTETEIVDRMNFACVCVCDADHCLLYNPNKGTKKRISLLRIISRSLIHTERMATKTERTHTLKVIYTLVLDRYVLHMKVVWIKDVEHIHTIHIYCMASVTLKFIVVHCFRWKRKWARLPLHNVILTGLSSIAGSNSYILF